MKFCKIFAANVRFPKFWDFPLNGRLVAAMRDVQIYGMYVTLKEGSYPMPKFCENKVNFLKKNVQKFTKQQVLVSADRESFVR